MELDRVKRRALAGASRTTTPQIKMKGTFMRSRLAITTTLTLGLFTSMGGAALGITALSTDQSASIAQYGTGAVAPTAAGPTATTPATGPGEVLGAQTDSVNGVADDSEDGVGDRDDTAPGGGVAGERVDSAPGEAVAQAPRQLEADRAGELPFTGYAGGPMLLIGLGLLITGMVLRRNLQRSEL